MFPLVQINEKHKKARRGADFPAYIRDIRQMGISRYETFVANGTTKYYDSQGEIFY